MEESPVSVPLGTALRRTAGRWPDALAVTEPDARASYRELLDEAECVAAGMQALGVRRGDHVGLLMVNGLTACQVLFGCWLLGAVAVPMNSRYKASELRQVIAHADIACLFIEDSVKDHVDHHERLVAAFPDLSQADDPQALALGLAPRLRSVVYLGKTTRAGFLGEAEFGEAARRFRAEAGPLDEVAMSDPAVMIYTSGTTAHPKGCVHSHATIARQAYATGEVMALSAKDRLWDPLPVCHIGGIIPMVAAIQAHASYHTMGHFEPGQALRHLESVAATLGYIAFPTLISSLVEHPDFPSTDLGALRWLLAIGPPAALRRVQQALPRVVQAAGYGATELGGVVTYSRIGDTPESRATTCGRPLPGTEIRISDPNGRLVGSGIVGEIEMRGPSRILGYYRDEGELQVSQDGWLKTGDLGALTREGEVVFAGRFKDMLKIGGENVAAAEIEAFLVSHPAVAVAAVVGVPDQRLDEVAAAFVEVVPNATVTESELLAFCEANIAGFKVPRFVRFVQEWPMSATKVQKYRLREMLLREIGELV